MKKAEKVQKTQKKSKAGWVILILLLLYVLLRKAKPWVLILLGVVLVAALVAVVLLLRKQKGKEAPDQTDQNASVPLSEAPLSAKLPDVFQPTPVPAASSAPTPVPAASAAVPVPPPDPAVSTVPAPAKKTEPCYADFTCHEIYGGKRLKLEELVVLDVETTGLSPYSDRVIEFSAALMRGGEIVDTYTTLINPGVPLPPKITYITGLKDEDLAGAPAFEEVAEKIRDFIGDHVAAAHNADFDLRFLTVEFARIKWVWSCDYIDTVELARDAYPSLSNHKLDTLIKKLNLLDHEQDHRAESDVLATCRLYERCKAKIAKDLKKAIAAAENAPEGEDKAGAFLDLGISFENDGEVDKAMEYYRKAIDAGFFGQYPFERLAIIYRKRKQYAEAVQICQEAIAYLEAHGNNQAIIAQFQHRIEMDQKKLGKKQAAAVSSADT